MLSLISIERAVECMGRAIFREHWIGALTEDEDWYRRRYIEGSANPEIKNEPSSIIPGMITYMSTEGGKKGFFPLFEVQSAALREKIELARDKLDRMEDQRAQVDEWLEDHGFDPDAESLPAEAFFAALEREFGKVIDGAEQSRVAEAETTPPAVEQTRLIAAPDASRAPQLPAVEPDAVNPHIATRKRVRRRSKLEPVMDALYARYPKGYYSGLTTSVVLRPVTKWLEENRPDVQVSEDTIRNALIKFEVETKNS
jgi:hypothetical protein